MLYKGFPDYHGTIENIIAEGDKFGLVLHMQGHILANILGFAPSGKKISYKSVTIKRIVNGKMVEGWTVNDMVNAFKEIGVIEYTEQGKKLFPEEAS